MEYECHQWSDEDHNLQEEIGFEGSMWDNWWMTIWWHWRDWLKGGYGEDLESEAIEESGCRVLLVFQGKKNAPKNIRLWYHVEVERRLLRNIDLTFSLIKNEYIYTNLKHKSRKQFTQNTKIRNNPRISQKHKNKKLQLIRRILK